MIKDILHAVWRWLCRPLKGLLWFVAAYPFLVVVMYYTTDAFFPNRAELRRNIDWQNWSRGDLYLPNGQLIARNVGSLCWNATAVSGWGDPEGFVWLGGDQEVIYASDPGYLAWVARQAHAKGSILPDSKQNHYLGSGDPCGPMNDDRHRARPEQIVRRIAENAAFVRHQHKRELGA